MRLALGQLNEVIPVTGHQETTVFMRELEDERIDGFLRGHVAKTKDFVAEFSE